MKTSGFILALIFPGILWGQLDVSDTLIFDSPNDPDRTISGVAAPISATDAVNAETIITNSLNYASVSGTVNQIELSLFPAPTQYKPGMTISFFAAGINTDSVYVNLNGLGDVLLTKGDTMSLDSADLKTGLGVNAIYDGARFVVLSPLNRNCPTGFLSVNNYYCIQQDEQGSVTFWDAVTYCGDLDARLCSWSEWYMACHELGVSLNNMTDNWEFIDSAQNYDGNYLPKSTPKVAGEFACEESARSDPDVNRGFRCCYSK